MCIKYKIIPLKNCTQDPISPFRREVIILRGYIPDIKECNLGLEYMTYNTQNLNLNSFSQIYQATLINTLSKIKLF